MNAKIGVTFIIFLLDVALILVPWLPVTSNWFPKEPTLRELLDVVICMVGIQGTILAIYLGIMLKLSGDEWEERQNVVKQSLTTIDLAVRRGEVRQLRDDEFYVDFLKRARNAQHYVYISYLSPRPPDSIALASRRQYYEEIVRTVRQNPGVRFRRIVRDTPENRTWTQDLLDELKNKPNADIGLLCDPTADDMPFSLSIQIVDGRYAWIVATKSHERDGEYRDVSIDDAIVAKEFAIYHDRLWAKCTKLLESGRLTDTGTTMKESTDVEEG